MHFKTVAHTFQKMELTASRTAITELLADLLGQATAREAEHICYLSLGALNPPYIGTQFNLAQKSMIKVVAPLLFLTEHEVQMNLEKCGDLGSVIEQFEWAGSDHLSVEAVFKSLSAIEKVEGTGSQEKKGARIQELLRELDHISAKYVVRIILGMLRLGFSDMTIVDALSWMEAGNKSLRPVIEDAYNVCADIGLIAYELKENGIEKIRGMKIHVGIPIRPAAAERMADVEEIMTKMGPCFAQPKLDGFRLQVHVDKTEPEPVIRFFSRNLADMSAMFPEFVAACKELPVQTFIADGEAMVFDPNTKLFLSFQETVKRRRKHGIDEMVSEMPLQLYIFDVLYLDGVNLLNATHMERRRQLCDLLADNHNDTLQVIEERTMSTPQELEHYFLEQIAGGLEGLVIKKPDAIYQPGKRNFNWIKLKYQAADKLNDTMDLVILGYYPGKGRRAQFGIGAFLVGIYNPRDQMYETVAKVGTGLTDELWFDLKQRCEKLTVHEKPKDVRCEKSLFPAVWLYPSLVCEVLADEITLSPVHTAGKEEGRLGYALRFPRFVRFRDDKNSYQATTLAELETLRAK